MRKAKHIEKVSFIRSVFRALGMDKGSALASLSDAETKPGGSLTYTDHGFTRIALSEAEQAKGKALMEIRRKPIV